MGTKSRRFIMGFLVALSTGAASCGSGADEPEASGGGTTTGTTGAGASSGVGASGSTTTQTTGAGASGGVGGGGGVGAGGGTGGEYEHCSPTHCWPNDPCAEGYCDANDKCAEKPLPDGSHSAFDPKGDCLSYFCYGGVPVPEPEYWDQPHDGNPCTDDVCTDGVPSNPPLPIDTPCGPGGKSVCDGAGKCQECNTPEQCPGVDTECTKRTCTAGVCGIAFVPQGTLTAVQTKGDCMQTQCNGAGGVETVLSLADVEDDDNACTVDSCNGNVPVHTLVAAATPCGSSLQCDAAGTCVGCVAAADCPVPSNPCVVATCSAGACGTVAEVDGTPCEDGGKPGTCQGGECAVCGNGHVEGTEGCDDGNNAPCDGCSPDCQPETAITYSTGPGLDMTIPDNGYDGSPASMACASVTVTAAGDGSVDYVCPTVAMHHTWIGDLTIKLISPAGTVITLMSRPGWLEPADDGYGSIGTRSDLAPKFPVTWRDGAPTSAEKMGFLIGEFQRVCKDDLVCVYDPDSGAAAPGKLAAFIGENAAGTWKLCAGDGGPTETGYIDEVKLVIRQ